jgi:glycosyltransferase involved in cell wall biosynthesis
VQIIDQLRPVGGAERLQTTFAEAVRDEDVELTVVTLHDNDPASVRELEDLGARVVDFASPRFLSPGRARALSRFLRSGRFDVVHTHLVRSTILGCLVGRSAGIPTVATLHNVRRRVQKWGLLLAVESAVLRRATDRVVAVGWETARVHGARIGRDIEVIPNAVGELAPLSAAERAAVRLELGVPEDAPLALSVGRLHPQKGFPDLLRAFERVVAVQPDAHLRIAGIGRQRSELSRQIRSSALADRVELLGLRRDVPRLLGAADVYVSAALWEGLPVAILEAMAAGLPVVATRVGDVPRVVGPGMGALVEAGDAEGLADASIALLTDPALRRRQGTAARAHVRACFGREAWAARWLSLYRDLVGPQAAMPAGTAEEPRCAS